MMESVFTFYRKLVLSRPWLSVLFVLLVVGFFASKLPQLKLDASADSLVLEGDQALEYYREVSERYATQEFLLVTYRPEEPLMSDVALERLAEMRDKLAAVDHVSGVTTILDVPLLDSPRVSLSQVTGGELPTLSDDKVDREEALEEFTHSPLYKNLLTSADGQTTGLQVNLARDELYQRLLQKREALREKAAAGELDEQGERELERAEAAFDAHSQVAAERMQTLVSSVRDVLEPYRDEATVFLGGVPMIASDMIRFVKSDLRSFGLGILAFIVLLLAVIFRHPLWVVLPLATCLLNATFMLGLLAFLDWRMTVISSNFVALLLIITLSICIHLVVRYRELADKRREDGQEALVDATVQQMFKPCLYTGLTTLVAFASLVISGIRPVIDFGWMMTIGVISAFVLTFVLVPAVLSLFKTPVRAADKDNSTAFTMRFAAATEHYGGVILAVAGLMLIVSAYGATQLKVENRFIDYFHEDTEIYQGMETIDAELGGTIPLDVIIDAPSNPVADDGAFGDEFAAEDSAFADDFAADEGGFGDDFADEGGFGDDFGGAAATQSSYWFTIDGMRRISEVHDYLDGLEETGKVLSLATLYDLVNMIMGGGVDDLQLALVQRSLPEDVSGLLIDPYFSAEANEARITVRVMETSRTLERNELLKEVRRHLTEDLGFEQDQVHLTGMLVLYNNMLQSLFQSQILTLSAVFVAILLMFMILFRSLSLALIALAPNILAAGAVLGGMGLMGIPLDIMTITIAAITVGIGVDHAIHYVHRFKSEFPQDRNYLAAIYRCHGSIGKAMYYTAVIIIFGFSILALSNFTPSIYFGLLTGAAMFAALLGSLLLLPRLLMLFKPLGQE